MQWYVNVFIKDVYVTCYCVSWSRSIFDSDNSLVKCNSNIFPNLQSFFLNNFPLKLILLASLQTCCYFLFLPAIQWCGWPWFSYPAGQINYFLKNIWPRGNARQGRDFWRVLLSAPKLDRRSLWSSLRGSCSTGGDQEILWKSFSACWIFQKQTPVLCPPLPQKQTNPTNQVVCL